MSMPTPWMAARLPVLGACIALPVLAVGCDSPLSVSDPLLVTDEPSYVVRFDGLGWGAEIPYTFTNRTGASVYLVNCNGSFGLLLERWEDGQWKTAWSPVMPDCLSPPIVIADGQTFPSTVHMWGAVPGTNHYPQLDGGNPGGTYRIVWINALSSFQDHLPFGEQIAREYRVSNAFELVVE